MASGGQNPFYKKGSGLPKIFHWEGLDTVFSSCFFPSSQLLLSFVPLCVTSWLKTGGEFRMGDLLEPSSLKQTKGGHGLHRFF
jgi:hypothetical protein